MHVLYIVSHVRATLATRWPPSGRAWSAALPSSSLQLGQLLARPRYAADPLLCSWRRGDANAHMSVTLALLVRGDKFTGSQLTNLLTLHAAAAPDSGQLYELQLACTRCGGLVGQSVTRRRHPADPSQDITVLGASLQPVALPIGRTPAARRRANVSSLGLQGEASMISMLVLMSSVPQPRVCNCLSILGWGRGSPWRSWFHLARKSRSLALTRQS